MVSHAGWYDTRSSYSPCCPPNCAIDLGNIVLHDALFRAVPSLSLSLVLLLNRYRGGFTLLLRCSSIGSLLCLEQIIASSLFTAVDVCLSTNRGLFFVVVLSKSRPACFASWTFRVHIFLQYAFNQSRSIFWFVFCLGQIAFNLFSVLEQIASRFIIIII